MSEEAARDVMLELAAVANELRELVDVVSGESVSVPKKFSFDATRFVHEFAVKQDPREFHALKIDNATDHPIYVGFGGGDGQPGKYDEIVPARTGRVITRPYVHVSIGFNQADIPASVVYVVPVTFYSRAMPPTTYVFNPAGTGGAGGGVGASTATATTVADVAVDALLLAANEARVGATVYNDSSATLYVTLGRAGSSTDFTVKLNPNDYYELPGGYLGSVHGVWSADTAAGAARVTELA